MAINEKLRTIVFELYQRFCDGIMLEGQDVGSSEFLSGFTYEFLPREDESLCRKVFEAATDGHASSVDRAIEAFFSNWSGGDGQLYVCLAVGDFLNYAIPRTIGLADARERFDVLYDRFDSDFFSDTCTVTTFAVLSNVWDHSQSVILPEGFRLRYVLKGFVEANNALEREKQVPFFEINHSAHPVGLGRSINDKNAYFILECSKKLQKNKELLQAVSLLRDDVGRKFAFAVRLLKHSACFSDYRGFRTIGHLSALHLQVRNFPDDALSSGTSCELGDPDQVWLNHLLPRLMQMDYTQIFLMDQKIEDAIRRERGATFDQEMSRRRVAVDQLLDYFQILESILSVRGGEYMSVYGAVLLKASGSGQFSKHADDSYKFLKETFAIRNDIVHGRVDEVLRPRDGNFKPDVARFRQMVHVLASLFVLNGPLRDAARKLALGESVELRSLYKRDPDEIRGMRRRKQKSFESW